VSFAAIALCVVSQRVFSVVSVHFVIDSVRKLLDTPSYTPPPHILYVKTRVSFFIVALPLALVALRPTVSVNPCGQGTKTHVMS
jgi:hypothetical protein